MIALEKLASANPGKKLDPPNHYTGFWIKPTTLEFLVVDGELEPIRHVKYCELCNHTDDSTSDTDANKNVQNLSQISKWKKLIFL